MQDIREQQDCTRRLIPFPALPMAHHPWSMRQALVIQQAVARAIL
jgi:hypothetical protein